MRLVGLVMVEPAAAAAAMPGSTDGRKRSRGGRGPLDVFDAPSSVFESTSSVSPVRFSFIVLEAAIFSWSFK